MKRLVSLLAASLFSFAAVAAIPAPPTLNAKSYALLDYQTGDLIADFNADARVEPASITKVMTVYIAFDQIKKGKIHLDDDVPISEKAWHEGIDSSESRMFIEVGQRVKLSDLLRGIIIQSGNDAAVAVAEYIGGSEDAFAQMMNQYAQQLGMKNTHYMDASGMPNPEHYTTAHDIVILARALIHNFPDFYKIFSERDFTFHGIKQENRNGLLWKDSTVDGIKTGHTQAAGYCLLASAVRDNRRLISAVMAAPSWNAREQGNQVLLDWGFRFYETDALLGPASPVTSVRIWKGAETRLPVGTLQPVDLSLPSGSKDGLKIVPTLRTPVVAPIEQGQPVGSAEIQLDGKTLRTVDLVALKPIGKGSLWTRIIDQIRLWFHWV